MTKLLDLNELNQVERPYSRLKNIQTYEYFLEQCHKKIKEYNKVHRSKFCYYKPPLFLFGKPIYDYYDLMNYLSEQLTNNGLFSQITSNGLLICWDQSIIDLVKYRDTQNNMMNLSNLSQTQTQTQNQTKAVNQNKKTKQVSTRGQSSNRNRRQPETRVINLIKIENDDIPINLDAFNRNF